MAAPKTACLAGDPLLHQVWEQMGRPPGCRVTGGYLRDRLLGRSSNDLDLTIEGDAVTAEEPANRLAIALGFRAHLLGAEPHRIWRIETPELKIELWPMGGLSQEEDILRRDFSCNAMSWELPDGPLVDLVGGTGDLERGRLRAISRGNLEEDPVRLLRGPRFLAQLEAFEFDPETRGWIRELSPSLAEAPRERVGQELLALLRASSAWLGLRECLDLGLFEPAAPSGCRLDEPWLRENLQAMGRLCGAVVPPAMSRFGNGDDTARLAFLFRSWGIPTPGRIATYSWPRADRDRALRAAGMLEAARATVDAAPADRRELTWRAGSAFPTLLTLASALEPGRTGWRRWRRQWRRDPLRFTNPRPLLTGDEIAELTGIEPGPELGAIANALIRSQVRGEIRSRAGAARLIERLP